MIRRPDGLPRKKFEEVDLQDVADELYPISDWILVTRFLDSRRWMRQRNIERRMEKQESEDRINTMHV